MGKSVAVLTAAGAVGVLAVAIPALAADQSVTAGPDAAFVPQTVTVNVADTVTWDHSGPLAHNVDFDNGTYTMPATPSTDAWHVERTFNTPGSFTYHCDLHATMTGTVVVVDPSATATPTSSPTQSPTPGGTPTPTPFPEPTV